MRPSKFLLSLLPLAGYGLAVSQQRQQSEQSGHSRGVAPVELVGVLNGLASFSRTMRQDLLQFNKNTAAEMIEESMVDMITEAYTLIMYAKRLEDTPPFNRKEDTVALGIGFVKWKKYTSDFLVTLGQSSDILPKTMPQSAILVANLKALKTAANKFESVTPNLDRHIGWIELYVGGEASNLPANFERTIRRFASKPRKGKVN